MPAADSHLVCLQVIQLQDFQPATAEDICMVHSNNYVRGLEKIVSRPDVTIVEGGAPTYSTPTTYRDALRVSLPDV